ncbi:11301_t:CDS:2, partial [Acaulospora colombiana]
RVHRRSSVAAIPQGVYLGLELDYNEETHKVDYAICAHDGSYAIDYEFSSVDVDIEAIKNNRDNIEKVLTVIIEHIDSYAKAQRYKIHAIGIGAHIIRENGNGRTSIKKSLFKHPSLASKLWLELDAIPFIFGTKGSSVDERASSAVRKTIARISPQTPGSIPSISVGFRHEVEVDLNGTIKLVDLVHYEKTVCPETWRILNDIASELRTKKIKVSFFNATPQGGGDYAVYWIWTFTGMCQNQNQRFLILRRESFIMSYRLTPTDKEDFITWSENNAKRFWSERAERDVSIGGPIEMSDVIIIDDPQVCADLIRENPNGPQAETWDFLWGFISQADLFVSHPIQNFVPDIVPKEKVVLLPASTDPLDGLNKELRPEDKHFYKMIYNRLSFDQCAGWTDDRMPSLIICGPGSIDDPDGTPIYEQTNDLLQKSEYNDITDDVSVVRLPPCDQILNALLRDARVALQLSTREGFEVKVTEALAKGIPVVAFKAGGIPLQIKHGETGFLADVKDTNQVADYLFTLFTDEELYAKMSSAARSTLNEQYFTVFQTLNWLYLIRQFSRQKLLESGLETDDYTELQTKIVGNGRWVKELWAEEYGFEEKNK